MEKKTVTIGGNFSFERDRVTNVINALDAGDISECKAPDVKHVSELLEHLVLLSFLAPSGWLDNLLNDQLVALYRQRERQELDKKALDLFSGLGMGEEVKKVIESRNAPNQAGRVAAEVELLTKMNGGNKTIAMTMLSNIHGRDVESIRRQVNRTKARKK